MDKVEQERALHAWMEGEAQPGTPEYDQEMVLAVQAVEAVARPILAGFRKQLGTGVEDVLYDLLYGKTADGESASDEFAEDGKPALKPRGQAVADGSPPTERADPGPAQDSTTRVHGLIYKLRTRRHLDGQRPIRKACAYVAISVRRHAQDACEKEGRFDLENDGETDISGPGRLYPEPIAADVQAQVVVVLEAHVLSVARTLEEAGRILLVVRTALPRLGADHPLSQLTVRVRKWLGRSPERWQTYAVTLRTDVKLGTQRPRWARTAPPRVREARAWLHGRYHLAKSIHRREDDIPPDKGSRDLFNQDLKRLRDGYAAATAFGHAAAAIQAEERLHDPAGRPLIPYEFDAVEDPSLMHPRQGRDKERQGQDKERQGQDKERQGQDEKSDE